MTPPKTPEEKAREHFEKALPHLAEDKYYKENPDKSMTIGAYLAGHAAATAESQAITARAVAEARKAAFEEVKREAERERGVIRVPDIGHSAQSFGQDWAYSNLIEWLEAQNARGGT
jgi:hypothetical protein